MPRPSASPSPSGRAAARLASDHPLPGPSLPRHSLSGQPLPRRPLSRQPLAFSIALAILLPGSVAIATPALAQVPTAPGSGSGTAAGTDAAASPRQTFDLPAASLESLLNRVAGEAGVDLSVDSRLLEGRRADGLSGSYTVEEAFAALLRGQGLRALRQRSGGFVIEAIPRAAGPSDPVAGGLVRTGPAGGTGGATLATVEVRSRPWSETATGPVRGYAATRSSTATRTDTPLRETPQSVTVVTADQIRDTGSLSLNNVLNYAAGVNTAPYATSTRLDGAIGRANNDLETFLDGLDSELGYWARSVRSEPYALERVEVLRGPASMQFGQSSLAGIVNGVSKDPLPETRREIGLLAGSHRLRQLQTDLTGPLTEDGRLAYRLIALIRESDTQIDMTPDNRVFFAPSLTWKPTASTDWTFRLRYQKDRAGADSGAMPWSGTVLPNPNGRFSTRMFAGEPHADYFNTDSTSAGWSLEHRFNAAWKVRQTLRYTRSHQRYGAIDLRPSDDPAISPYLDDAQRLLDRDGYFWNIRSRTFATDQHLQGTFTTGPVQHRLLAGFDVLRYRYGQHSASDSSDEPGSLLRAMDGFAPVYDFDYRPPAYTSYSDTRTTQTGVYLQDQLRWGAWGLIGGIRHDRVETRVSHPQEGETSTEKDRATTRRVGLLRDLGPAWTTYLSYSEGFEPQGSGPTGQPLAPLRGKQWELGLRYVPPGGRFRGHVALYDLQQTNRLVRISPVDFTQTGEVKSRGVELELVGDVTRTLAINASYNYSHLESEELGGMPKHRAAIWGAQRVELDGIGTLVGGAGVRYNAAYRDRVAPITPSYTLFDLMLSLERAKWRWALNINNLTDKPYLGTCESWGICTYGARRNVIASASYRF